LFIPVTDEEILVTGVFGPLKITKPAN
jgi:hypothetical protein